MGGGIELEHNAAAVRATFGGRAVEGAFRVEYKSSNGKCAVGVVLEGVQDRQHMGGGIELEHRAAAARGAALFGRAVERAFRVEHQPGIGQFAIGAGEAVQRRPYLGDGIELEHRAAAARGAAKSSRAVE